MIKNAWYSVSHADGIDEQPRKFLINGKAIVVFRDGKQQIRAHGAFCPHRGCDLSLGTYNGEVLICPFHGWRFNKEGRCVHVPANLRDVAPKRSHLETYPACERFGLVWIYPVPKPHANPTDVDSFKEIKEDGWVRTPIKSTWHANFKRVVESVLDVSHLPFVHPDTTGTDISPKVVDLEYDVSDHGILIFPTPFAHSHPMEPPLPRPSTGERTMIELIFPNQWIIRTPIEGGYWMCTFLTFTPVSNGKTDIFGYVMRNFDQDLEMISVFHKELTDFVMKQDQTIIESLRPKAGPSDYHLEAHVASDVPALKFREMLRTSLEKET